MRTLLTSLAALVAVSLTAQAQTMNPAGVNPATPAKETVKAAQTKEEAKPAAKKEAVKPEASKEAAKPATAAAPATDDASLTAAVKTKLANTPSLKDANINVAVSGGVATLTGVLAKGQLKGVATRVVKSVAGVKSVENKIEIEKKAAAPKSNDKGDKKEAEKK